MITKEQVADLQRGDVVTFHDWSWPDGHEVTGPVYATDEGGVAIASHVIRFGDGDVTAGNYDRGTLTVVSRAPRPLYVNHDRTEPAPGDTVLDEEADEPLVLLRVAGQRFADKWIDQYGNECVFSGPKRLRLLVDGETGQVVP